MLHRTMLGRVVAAAAVLVAALALSACSSPASTPSSASTEVGRAATLRLGTVTKLSSFAPWQSAWQNQSPYLQAVYDTLLREKPDGTTAPGLATKWAWNESKTVLTLTLRKDVKFSDGTALTAQVAADNLIHFRDGTSQNANVLASMTSAEAPNDTTLVLTLSAADPAFLVYLSQNAGLVAGPAMFDSPDAQTTPIGSGPYVLDTAKTVVGSKWVFDAKKDYWDPQSVHYNTIEMTLYSDPTALMNAVKGGQVDASNLQISTQIAEAEAAGYKAISYERNWTGFLLVDRDGKMNPALGDVRVRQAINYALDRKGLLQAMEGGLGTVTTQVFDTHSTAYDKALDKKYPYDPAKAKKLMAEAGYAHGFTLTMPSSTFVPESTFALYKQQLGAIGINVEWQQTGSDLFSRMLSGSWPAFTFLLQQDPTSWQTIKLLMLPQSTWNTSHVADPTVMKLAEIVRAGNGADAAAAAKKLNTYIVDQAWFAPIYRPTSAFITATGTAAERQVDNAVPYLWNIRPTK